MFQVERIIHQRKEPKGERLKTSKESSVARSIRGGHQEKKLEGPGEPMALQAVVTTLASTWSPCRVWAKQRGFLTSLAAVRRAVYKTRSEKSRWEVIAINQKKEKRVRLR